MIIATVIWGFAFVAQKAAVILPAFAVGSLRSAIASVFILAIIPLTDRLTKNNRSLIKNNRPDITKSELIGGGVIGVILTIASAFQQIGIEGTDAGKTAFITALYVVLVPIFALFLGKKSSLNVWIAVPIAILGFYFLCIKPGVGIQPSDLLILLCAVIFACHITAVDRLSEGCDGVRMSLVQFTVAFILNTALSLIFEKLPSGEAVIGAMPSLLFLGIGSSGIAYTLQIVGQKETEPAVASIIHSLESVFGVVGASFVLGEKMSGREYLGCAIVFCAVLIAQLEPDTVKKWLKSNKKANNT